MQDPLAYAAVGRSGTMLYRGWWCIAQVDVEVWEFDYDHQLRIQAGMMLFIAYIGNGEDVGWIWAERSDERQGWVRNCVVQGFARRPHPSPHTSRSQSSTDPYHGEEPDDDEGEWLSL